MPLTLCGALAALLPCLLSAATASSPASTPRVTPQQSSWAEPQLPYTDTAPRLQPSRQLRQVSADLFSGEAALSSFVTAAKHASAPSQMHAATVAAVAGLPISPAALTPAVAKEVEEAEEFNLEGDAPGNEEPYTVELSNPHEVPNTNVDRRNGSAPGGDASPSRSTVLTARANASSEGMWSFIGHSGCIAIHASLSVDNKLLFFERPHTTGKIVGHNPHLTLPQRWRDGVANITEVAASFDLKTNRYSPVHMREAPFCAGHLYGPQDTCIIIGGDNRELNFTTLVNGLQTAREYDSAQEFVFFAQNLSSPRWYPTLATLPTGSIFVAGGSITESGGYGGNKTKYNNPTYQIYSTIYRTMTPSITLQQLVDTWPINLYPFLFVMPFSGSMLLMAGNRTRVYRNVDFSLDKNYGSVPDLKIPFSHPQTATLIVLPLDPTRNYTVTAMVIGGCSTDFCVRGTQASATTWRIDVGREEKEWVEELMPARRVLGSSTLLPDGTVFVANGAEVGYAGGFPKKAYTTKSVTRPLIYDPDAPREKRWSKLLADSHVPRLYHSSMLLLPTAEVLVAGSEVTLEYRIQVFTPPYLLKGNPRPKIVNAPGNITWTKQYLVRWSGTESIDRVVLQKLSDNTHGLSFDLRQVVLEFAVMSNATDERNGTLAFSSPPGDTIAPPGTYMLFLLWQGTPSNATYVKVHDERRMDPLAPLANGTYLIMNAGKSLSCGGNEGMQYLARTTNCKPSLYLRTSELNSSNTLELKWELALAPGSTNKYYIYTPIKAVLGCPSQFLSPGLCVSPAQAQGNTNVSYGSYTPSSRLLWELEPVKKQLPHTFKLSASSEEQYSCGGMLSSPTSNLCKDNRVTTRPEDDQDPATQYWHFTMAA